MCFNKMQPSVMLDNRVVGGNRLLCVTTGSTGGTICHVEQQSWYLAYGSWDTINYGTTNYPIG